MTNPYQKYPHQQAAQSRPGHLAPAHDQPTPIGPPPSDLEGLRAWVAEQHRKFRHPGNDVPGFAAAVDKLTTLEEEAGSDTADYPAPAVETRSKLELLEEIAAKMTELTAQRDELLKACDLQDGYDHYYGDDYGVYASDDSESSDVAFVARCVELGWDRSISLSEFVSSVREAAIARVTQSKGESRAD